MQIVNYSGQKDGKPVKLKVYIEEGLDVPQYIVNPTDSSILTKVGKIERKVGKPEKGSALIKRRSKEEIEKLAEEDTKNLMSSFKEDDPLAKYDASHWKDQFIDYHKKTGTLTLV